MHYPALVTVKETVQDPPHYPLDLINAQAFPLRRSLVQKVFQVHIQKFEHQVELVIAVQNVLQLHHGRVVQLLEQADLPELDARYAFIRVLYLDLLERDDLKKRISTE